MLNEIKEFAAAYGLNPESVSNLIDFLARHAATPQGIALLRTDSDQFMRIGVEEWHKQGTAFYTELLENKTANAKKVRRQIASDVWNHHLGVSA